MTMRRYATLLATVGKFETAAGPVKRRIPVGALYRDDATGRMSIQLEAVPVVPGWSGWLSVELVDDAVPPEERGN